MDGRIFGDALKDTSTDAGRSVRIRLLYGVLDPSVVMGSVACATVISSAIPSLGEHVLVVRDFTDQTLRITLGLHQNYSSFSEASFSVLLSGDCLVGRRTPVPSMVNMTVYRTSSPENLPAIVSDGLALAAFLSAVGASFVSLPMATRAAAAQVVQLVQQCNHYQFAEGRIPLPFELHILRFSVGAPEDLGYFIAGLILNHAIIVLVFVFHFGFAASRGAPESSRMERFAAAQFPGKSFVAVVLLLHATAFCSFVCVFRGTLSQQVGGCISLLMCAIYLALAAMFTTSLFGAKWRAFASEEQSSARLFVQGRGEWIDSHENAGFCRRLGALFTTYCKARQWFLVIEMIFAVGYGVILALLPLPGNCGDQALALCCVAGVELLLNIAMAARSSPVLQCLMNFIFVVQFTASLLVALYHGGLAGSWGLPASTLLSVLLFALIVVTAVILLVLCTSHHGKGSDADEDGDEIQLESMQQPLCTQTNRPEIYKHLHPESPPLRAHFDNESDEELDDYYYSVGLHSSPKRISERAVDAQKNIEYAARMRAPHQQRANPLPRVTSTSRSLVDEYRAFDRDFDALLVPYRK